MFTDLVLFDDLEALKKASKKLKISFIIAKEFKNTEEVKKISAKKSRTCLLLRKADEKAIARLFGKTDFIAVVGGKISLNKFAVSSKLVDFLIAPCSPESANIDTAIFRIAKENNVAMVFPYSEFASLPPFRQFQLFKHYLLVAKLCKRFRVKMLFCSLAKNSKELKKKKELIEMGKNLGFSEKQLGEWHSL